MYRDVRPASLAGTPEMWAETFATSTKVSKRRLLRMRMSKEWKLIRRQVPRGARIVDAGCGFGEWVAFLNAMGYRAEGCDYSSQLVERLRETYPTTPWHAADIRHMPYADGEIDAVISWGVIEHDETGPGAALREFHRILRPGGIAVVTVPVNSEMQRRATEQVMVHFADKERSFFQYFMSPEELSGELAAAGFQPIEARTLPYADIDLIAPRWSLSLSRLQRRVVGFGARLLLSRFERYHVMVYCVARKT